MRGLLAFCLGKERQEDAHPWWQALDLFPTLSMSSFLVCLCPYCSLSLLHSLPLSLQVSHLWKAWKGGFG